MVTFGLHSLPKAQARKKKQSRVSSSP